MEKNISLYITIFIFTVIATVTFVSCSISQNGSVYHYNDSAEITNIPFALEKGWRYGKSESDDIERSRPDFSSWQSVEIEEFKGFPCEKNTAMFFTRDINISDTLKDKELNLSLGLVSAVVRVYWNGVRIYRLGNVSPVHWYSIGEMRIMNVPPELVRYDGKNNLTIAIEKEGTTIDIGPVILGDRAFYRKQEIRNFFYSEIYRYFSFLMFFISMFFLFQFIKNPGNTPDFWFMLVDLFFFLYFYRMGFIPPFMAPYYSLSLSKSFLYLAIGSFIIFLVQFLDIFNKNIVKVTSALVTITVAVFFAVVPQNHHQVDIWFIRFHIVMLALLVFIAIVSVLGLIKKREASILVFIGVLTAFLGGIHDISMMILGIFPYTWMQGYASFIFNLCMFIAIALTNINLRKRLANYSREVENQVKIRTAELAESNTRLKNAMQRVEQANRAKDEFLANVSHEVRTPLNCIMGYSELIAADARESKISSSGARILHESEKLMELINQILDISKMESGKLDLDIKPFDLKHSVKSVAETLRMRAEKNYLEFREHYPADLPQWVLGDSLRLGQILMNLLGNAVKFTESGYVSLSLSIEKIQKEWIYIQFTIEDTGIGIKEDIREKVFESFQQGDTSISRRYGGSGLGLAIAHRIISKMNGIINMKTIEGKGTAFTISIPFQLPDKEWEKKTRENNAKTGIADKTMEIAVKEAAPKVLLVEDYRPNQELAAFHLEQLGCTVRIAENGNQAVWLFRQEPFDLILMDVQLPELDGMEATKRIRSLSGGDLIPIVGVTANAFPRDLVQYYSAGMNDILTKPYRRSDFIKKLYVWLVSGGVVENLEQDKSPKDSSDKPVSQLKADNEETQILDYASFISEVGGNRKLADDIISGFLEEVNEQVSNIEDGCNVGDVELVHRELHSIKGGAANIYALKLYESTKWLEEEVKTGNLQTAEENINTIKQAISDLKECFEKESYK